MICSIPLESHALENQHFRLTAASHTQNPFYTLNLYQRLPSVKSSLRPSARMAEYVDEDELLDYGYTPMTLGARPNTGAYVNSRGRHTGPTLLTGAYHLSVHSSILIHHTRASQAIYSISFIYIHSPTHLNLRAILPLLLYLTRDSKHRSLTAPPTGSGLGGHHAARHCLR